MNKALNILEQIYQQTITTVFNKKDIEFIQEAIEELEEAMKPKSCEVCKYFDRFKCLNKHSIAFEAKYGVCNSDYCNKHELKDEQ